MGVYYDVAEWTDQFYTFGGEASGAYAQGDGGINGTGRAETAVQYRNELGPLALGLQVQNRDRTDSDRNYGDSFGGSLTGAVGGGLRLGTAYNEVRDGVSDPGPNDPHEGDRALIVGATWQSDAWIVAATYAIGRERDLDDQGVYFDSRGIEGFVLRKLDRHGSVFGGLNWLEPDDSGYDGDYRILNLLWGCSYQLNHAVVISGEGRVEESRDAAGDRSRESLFSLGLNLGW